MTKKSRYLSVRDVAEMLGVSRHTARRWMLQMPRLQRGRVLRVSEAALERFIEENTEYPTCRRISGGRSRGAAKSGTRGSVSPMEGPLPDQQDAPISQQQGSADANWNEKQWPKPTLPRTKPRRTRSDKR